MSITKTLHCGVRLEKVKDGKKTKIESREVTGWHADRARIYSKTKNVLRSEPKNKNVWYVIRSKPIETDKLPTDAAVE